MLRTTTSKRPPRHRVSVDEEAAIRAWLDKHKPTRGETKFVAASQLAPAPAAVEVPVVRPAVWSRAPRQDIEASLDEIARLHGLGLSSYAIGKQLKCDHRCVEYRLKRLGLK